MAIIGHTYHIAGLRNHLKKLSRQCPTCQRSYNRGVQQQMRLLPITQTSSSPSFAITGLDFAGPFTIKRGHTCRPTKFKSYACLFMCMATKAVHIELCADLTIDEFLPALHRFCARRGTPQQINSDNGSNFVGAFNEIKDIEHLVHNSKQKLSHYCGENSIEWRFIPPRSPKFGGIREAGVKLMKILMRKNISPHLFQFHELSSLLTEIEAILT